jgi:hypothetical protein
MLTAIVCDGCGRRFYAEDATDMLAAITEPCPCGGTFRGSRPSAENGDDPLASRGEIAGGQP